MGFTCISFYFTKLYHDAGVIGKSPLGRTSRRFLVERIPHPITNIHVRYIAETDSVTLTLASKQTFPTGGQITVLGGSSGGIIGSSGAALGETRHLRFQKAGKTSDRLETNGRMPVSLELPCARRLAVSNNSLHCMFTRGRIGRPISNQSTWQYVRTLACLETANVANRVDRGGTGRYYCGSPAPSFIGWCVQRHKSRAHRPEASGKEL